MKVFKTLGICALVAVATLAIGAGSAFASIANSKHDLSSGTASGGNSWDQTASICVFCHTPHGADTSAPVPLWNKTLPTTTYSTYASLGTTTLDAAQADIGSVSLACLSCHDGSTAMDSMLNQPGSGTGTLGAGTWTTPGATVDVNGKLINVGGSTFPMVGADLRNDHPVSIQYAGVVPNVRATGLDPDFVAATETSSGSNLWYVDRVGSTAGRDKSDMILYTRKVSAGGTTDVGATLADNAGGTNDAFVECASCHDPHAANNVPFLRTPNTGSAVCLACHVK